MAAPYLGYCAPDDPTYLATRRTLLSDENPYYYEGEHLKGIGSPHTPPRYVWPIALSIEAMTSDSKDFKAHILDRLVATVAKALEHNVKTSDGMNWNLQDLVYEALSEEWRKRDGEISDPWANDEADGYQPPSYEPVNPERRTAQTPSDGLI